MPMFQTVGVFLHCLRKKMTKYNFYEFYFLFFCEHCQIGTRIIYENVINRGKYVLRWP